MQVVMNLFPSKADRVTARLSGSPLSGDAPIVVRFHDVAVHLQTTQAEHLALDLLKLLPDDSLVRLLEQHAAEAGKGAG